MCCGCCRPPARAASLRCPLRRWLPAGELPKARCTCWLPKLSRLPLQRTCMRCQEFMLSTLWHLPWLLTCMCFQDCIHPSGVHPAGLRVWCSIQLWRMYQRLCGLMRPRLRLDVLLPMKACTASALV